MTPQALVDAGLELPQLLQILYGDVDGYGLSNQGRERAGVHMESMTYGEVTPDVMMELMQTANAQPGQVFYDLGSGTGKPALFASMLTDLGKCVGIELLPELNDAAQMVLQRYQDQILPYLPQKHWQQIEYRCADMMEQDISDADIVFTHCTCFAPMLMDAIRAKCEQLKVGAIVITISKELGSPLFAHADTRVVQMAWGTATAYFWKKI